jgi:hypothetical protein
MGVRVLDYALWEVDVALLCEAHRLRHLLANIGTPLIELDTSVDGGRLGEREAIVVNYKQPGATRLNSRRVGRIPARSHAVGCLSKHEKLSVLQPASKTNIMAARRRGHLRHFNHCRGSALHKRIPRPGVVNLRTILEPF